MGHLWQDRFKGHIIENDEYLLASGLYIDKNPVEAGIVKNPLGYPWSSYRYYAIGENNPLVDPYESMGKFQEERQKRYRELMFARMRELGLIEN